MNVLDLFSGIGGFALGLDRAGMHTAAFCEIDQAARKVLTRRFPNIPIFEDVATLTKETLDHHGITIDVIVGGFPCQDISLAGKGAGLSGERSGLWFEFHRLIQEIKPKFIIAENVAALRNRGLDEVLRSLSEIGYDAEWHCIPASFVGACHKRDRVWIIAYPNRQHVEGSNPQALLEQSRLQRLYDDGEVTSFVRLPAICEPGLHRTYNGLPGQVDRLKQLGNSVVPQIPEMLGRILMEKHYDQ